MVLRHGYANFVVATAACLGVLGLLCSPSAAQPTLLGYWPLNETDVNSAAADASGSGLDGTYEGAVTPGVPGAPGFGLAADFDGVTGQVLIGPGDVNGLGNLVNDFTVMAWINPDDFGSKNRVFGSAPTGGGWGWGTAGTALQITTYGVRDFTQGGPDPLEADVWRHAAVALDSSNVAHFYLDGELIGSQSHGAPGNPIANNFYIGFSCCAAEHFDGQLDEVGVYSGVLTQDQIKNAMTFGVPFLVPPDVVFGDFNGDNLVNQADYEILATNVGAHFDRSVVYEDGDINRDGRIDLRDFGAFKAIPDRVAGATSVPEPSTLGLALLFVTGLLATGRRQSVKGAARSYTG